MLYVVCWNTFIQVDHHFLQQNHIHFEISGTINVLSDVETTLQILGLAHQYSFADLQTALIKQIKPLLNLENICTVFNTANIYDLEELLQTCHSFMELNALEVVAGDCFTDLSQVKPE